jgi:hypothetical protein
VASSCDHGNESLRFIKRREIVDSLSIRLASRGEFCCVKAVKINEG